MKSFVSFLYEMPQINTYISKERFKRKAAETTGKLSSLPHKDIGRGIYHHKDEDGRHFYFNKDSNGNAKDLSVIDKDNIQKSASKGGEGSHNIHDFMIKHAENHGKVTSDETNTMGSKHLWSTLVKSAPKNKTFHMVDHNSGSEHLIDKNNIDAMSHKIWGKSDSHGNINIEMRHHD
jgi:hypothetical protein